MKWKFSGVPLNWKRKVRGMKAEPEGPRIEGSLAEYPDGRMFILHPDPEMTQREVCDLGLRETQVAPLTVRLEHEDSQNWMCGCGHWNGPNLAECGMCHRTPQESLGAL
jgi:hypothetical protein